MSTMYVPDRGDIVWINFDPTLGSEQKGRRPALIMTPKKYNTLGMCYAMPITSVSKGYKIEVPLKPNQKIQGVCLLNQMRAMAWKRRHVEYIEVIKDSTLQTIQERMKLILGF